MGWQDAPKEGGKSAWSAAPVERKPISQGKAFNYGLGDSVSFGLMDEAGAVLDSLGIGGSGEKRPNVWNGSSFGDAYTANQRRNAEILKQASSDNPGTYLTGQIAGALLPIPGAAALKGSRAGQAVARVAGTNKATRAVAAIAPDVLRGAAYGAGSADSGNRLSGASQGAVLGAAGNLAGRAVGKTVSRVAKGKTVSPAVRKLADAGVVMTPGQRAGVGSVRNKYEQTILGNIPFVNAVPAAAKRRGVEQLNIAAINEATAPIGYSLPMTTAPGRDTIGKVQDAVYDAYGNAASALSLQSDNALQQGLAGLVQNAPAKVGQANADQFTALAGQHMAPLANGPISGRNVTDMLADLRREASSFAGSPVANERRLGDQLWAMHDEIDSALARQNTSGASEAFSNARDAVANLKRIETAAAASTDGVFSPTQLASAVKRRGYGTTTAKLARGDARLQELADAAKSVLPDTIPNSGTPERLFAGSLLGGGTTGLAAMMDPTLGAMVGGSLLGYTRGADRFLQNLALNRPDTLVRLGNGIDRAAPALGTAGAVTALQFGR